MRLHTLLLIGGLLALVFGLGFLLAPRPVLSIYGVVASPVVMLLARFFGAALVQLGLILLLIRDVGDPRTQRGVVLGSFLGSLAGLVVALSGQFWGVVNAVGGRVWQSTLAAAGLRLIHLRQVASLIILVLWSVPTLSLATRPKRVRPAWQ